MGCSDEPDWSFMRTAKRDRELIAKAKSATKLPEAGAAREAFEEWAQPRSFLLHKSDKGEYSFHTTDYAWQIWKWAAKWVSQAYERRIKELERENMELRDYQGSVEIKILHHYPQLVSVGKVIQDKETAERQLAEALEAFYKIDTLLAGDDTNLGTFKAKLARILHQCEALRKSEQGSAK